MKVHLDKRKRSKDPPGIFIHVSPAEAYSIIASLVNQLHDESANGRRAEHSPKEGASYLSIAIDFEGVDTTWALKERYEQEVAHWKKLYTDALRRIPVKDKTPRVIADHERG